MIGLFIKSGARLGLSTAMRRVLAVLVIVIPLAACGVNTIPSLEEEVNASWSQVLNQYQRRSDLIPNLVETVRGAADFERETLQAVVEARSRVAQTNIPPDILNNEQAFEEFQANQAALGSALSRLLVVVERYPELKANQNFIALQSQLEGTENRIAVARRDYIETVRRYNTELRTFPGVVWAATVHRGAEPKENFTIAESAMEAPRIRF